MMSERRERFLTWLLTLVALALLSPLRASGNTLTTGSKSFTYDSENHLTSMTASGTTVSIIYDAFGNRVSKKVNGVTTKYLVEDDMNPTGYPQVLDELTNGVVTRTYTYGLQRISQDQVIENLWTPSFYGYDGGGNVRQLTNSLGTVTDKYEYDAFGNDVYHTGTTPNNYLYRGEQYDSDLGLYYLRARYYNPATGRFLSRDPEDGKAIDPKTLHKYLYAGGDPVNSVDPTGRLLFDYELVTARDAVTTLAYTRRIASLSRCVFAIEILALKYFDNKLPWNFYTEAGFASMASGCIAAAFPGWPL